MRRVQILLAMVIATGIVMGLASSAGAVGVRLADGQFLGVTLQRGVNPAAVRGSLDRRPGSTPLVASPLTEPDSDAKGDVAYHGGPVLHSSSPYLIFWDPSKSLTARNKQVLKQYLTDVAADTKESGDTFGVGRQYYDADGFADASQTFSAAQAIVDEQPYPAENTHDCTEPGSFTACVTDAQVQEEISRLIKTDKLPTDGATSESEFPGDAPIYVVILPVDTNECESQGECLANTATEGEFCAYHSGFEDAGGDGVLYAVVPFGVFALSPTKGCQTDNPANEALQSPNENDADVIVDDMSHELNETITDPLGTSWVNYPEGDGQELADNCEEYGETAAPQFGQSPDAYEPTLGGSATPVSPDPDGTLYDQLINGDKYYTQSLWSNGATNCLLQTPTAALTPTFSAPAGAARGASVIFNPEASTSAAGFSSATWNFGDGSTGNFTIGSPSAVAHTFASTGDYKVTLTVVDVDGDLESTSRTIDIALAPTASFTAPPAPVVAGSPASFNAGASTDPNSGASISSYTWNFGDGASGSGLTATHVYAKPGTYTVTLTVTDSLGISATTTESVTVVAAGTIAKIRAKGESLQVTVSEAGRITVGRTVKKLARAGEATFTIALTPAEKRLVKRHKRFTLAATVVYAPQYGPALRRTVHWTA